MPHQFYPPCLITWIQSDQHRPWSSSLCNFLISCCLLPLSTSCSAPFWNTPPPPVCAPPSNVTDQVSNPNKTTGKMIIMYMSLDSEHKHKRFLPKLHHAFPEFKLLPMSLCQHYWHVSILCVSTTDMLVSSPNICTSEHFQMIHCVLSSTHPRVSYS
jgi:hypothetical protein